MICSRQFVPPELTVHILRPPTGEWICLDARTLIQSEGIGLTTADLFDERGFVGKSGQTLLISRRTTTRIAWSRWTRDAGRDNDV